jgi:ribosomal-protein-alanine N-acetyltransferase
MTTLFDFSNFPVLTTERLCLRQLIADDADGIQMLFGDPQVLRYLNLPPTDTREKALALIEWLSEDYQKHNTIQWSILRQADDLWLGTCGLHAWDQSNRRAEIGYHILPGHWGQGYATEATRAMLRWGFENLNLHRIQSDCTEGNIASERVMLKCGFTYEGLWRESCWEHERFVNIKQFGLLRREFE